MTIQCVSYFRGIHRLKLPLSGIGLYFSTYYNSTGQSKANPQILYELRIDYYVETQQANDWVELVGWGHLMVYYYSVENVADYYTNNDDHHKQDTTTHWERVLVMKWFGSWKWEVHRMHLVSYLYEVLL